MLIVVDETYLKEVNRLVNENIALKKQINDIKLEGVAKEVAKHVDDWLDEPYKGKTPEQDRQEFALRITRYIDHRLQE